ncbi:hypothetical protein [Roseofilum casamattae]|uniref:Uncharacterized protein n=1 Tax=Roseofilum casamattae BLCC-M143 TaxID=3022442 RepID=A0ABT7BW91_9CYAN|nr:hypothetical protein [Roseofilum casamattae]MDJ1183459.1 hypothetical protein [Roseofilum casamattae BLCC-M143]
MNPLLKLTHFRSGAIAVTLALSCFSALGLAQPSEAKPVTLQIEFFSSKRNQVGMGQFTYDDAEPYQTIHGVEYFAIDSFRATIESQSWDLDHLIAGSQPLLWAPNGERYPLPRIATVGGFGALTPGWSFFKPRAAQGESYGVLLLKNPGYKNQGDFALTSGVQDVLQGGVFQVEEVATPSSTPSGTRVPQRSSLELLELTSLQAN